MKKICSFIITISLLLSPILVLGDYNQANAKAYLQKHTIGPWSIMALSAMGETNLNLDALKNISTNNAIDYEAPILAIVAANQNPKTFPNQDYVAKLKSFHIDGQIGNAATLNDDIFGILALVSSGEALNDTVITDAKNFLLGNQNSDGGWGFTASSSSDTNMTAAGILALLSAGIPASDQSVQDALTFLKNAQNNDGGFPYDPSSSFGTDSDSSSTAWVIWTLNALGIDPTSWSKPNGNPILYLENQQTEEGHFKYQTNSSEDSFSPVTTSYAAIALLGKTLPLRIFSLLQRETGAGNFSFRIEGSSETVCEGKTAGPTALDIVKNASSLCGFGYHISETSFGPYLDKIGNDAASGLSGWLYFVNNESPPIGAADYQLQENDEVLWYFGDFGWKPTRLTLSDDEISSGNQATAAVKYFENGNWLALQAADVSVGAQNFTTNSSGQAAISNIDGYYKVFAEKAGYIRSNKVLLKIGDPLSSKVNLSVNINGQIQGTTTKPSLIGFSVNPDYLDFGSLNPGESRNKEFVITNTGNLNIEVEAIVDGDSVFKEGLKLNDSLWRKFKTSLGVNQNQEVDVNLSIPKSFMEFGQKRGSITIWAQ